jgi:hypothetical protein
LRVELPPPLTAATLEAIVQEWRVGSRYTHGSGQFSVADLPSWDRQQRGRLGDAYVIFSNQQLASFVEVAVIDWAGGTSTAAARLWLSEENLAEIWSIYDSWAEVKSKDDGRQLVADYSLVYRSAPFLGQISAIPAGQYLVTVTIVVPGNAPRLLTLLHKLVVPTVIVLPDGKSVHLGPIRQASPLRDPLPIG